MAIENIVNANAKILDLLLSRYQLVGADTEVGTLSFDVNGREVMVNTCNKSQIARDLTMHVLEKNGVTSQPISTEILESNLEAMVAYRADAQGLIADVLDCAMGARESVSEEEVAVATVE